VRTLDKWATHGSFQSNLENIRECVSALCTSGANVDLQKSEFGTKLKKAPLWDAVENFDSAAILALLEHGANANVPLAARFPKDHEGNSLPLHRWSMTPKYRLAYPESYSLVLQALLDHTDDWNARTNEGLTPLHCSIDRASSEFDFSEWRETAELLLNRRRFTGNVDIDARDQNGRTPLLYALESTKAEKKLSCVPVLQQFGADIRVRDNAGRDYVFYVLKYTNVGDDSALNMIRDYLAPIEPDRHIEELSKSRDSKTGLSAFLLMIQQGYLNCVRYALRIGIDPNDHTAQGKTALDVALETGNRVRLDLLERWANRYEIPPEPGQTSIPDILFTDTLHWMPQTYRLIQNRTWK
jgi:ankyrin repeat protein